MVFVSARYDRVVEPAASLEFPVRCCKSQVQLLEFGNVEGELMASQKIVSPGEPPSADANPSKVCCRYPKLDYSKQSLVGVNIDLEERKLAEFYLAEGQRLAHMGSWAFDPDGFYYWSPELFRMHGLDPASKPPSVQDYLDCVHPHDGESMADLIKGILAKASTFDATKRIVRPNGEVRYIRYVGAPVVENQSMKKYIGSAIDVTEHEILTQELRRREAYLAEAQRLSHTGSFGWKPDTGKIVWSDETYRIFEHDRSVKPTIDSVVQRVHPQDRADFQKVIDGASRGGQISSMPTACYCLMGESSTSTP
jgi:PAS domain S-box-containing protein